VPEQTHTFSTTILWAKPCGSGYSHSLFVKKTKKDKGAQTNAPIPFAKTPPLSGQTYTLLR